MVDTGSSGIKETTAIVDGALLGYTFSKMVERQKYRIRIARRLEKEGDL